MNNKLITTFLTFIFLNGWIIAQPLVQTVRGTVTDKESGFPLTGVIVRMSADSSGKLSSATDLNGNFKISGVPVGRRSFIFSFTGYKTWAASDIIVVSGKESVLTVEMEEEAMTLEEVKVVAEEKGSFNDMSSVSTKLFSIEETDRYPGSRSDPARMASNFAGVQGSNDSRNDIVVRGNSPSGILWRLEEIDIPNPNHFAISGSAGGPVSIINNKYLANSEFFTGAFPSFYGNALGGVFDLKMRSGNNQKHERSFQFGILGTEIGLEGPISKSSGSSYLINYRYSTLDYLQGLNFKLGTSAVPKYQDVGFRLNFPTKKAGTFSLSGIGGLSSISIILDTLTKRPEELYGDQNRNQIFNTNMGVAILNHVISISEKTLLKTSLAFSSQFIKPDHYLILRDSTFKTYGLPHILTGDFTESKITLASFIKKKINARNSFKTGFFLNQYLVGLYDSVKMNSVYETNPDSINAKPWKVRVNAKETFLVAQPYFNYTYKFGKCILNAGVHSQWMSLNNSVSVEPRVGIKYSPNDKNMFSAGLGTHSQMQPTYIYFAAPDSLNNNGIITANTDGKQANRNLDFSKSQHVVLGYDYFPQKNLRFKFETYYQYLWNIPVYTVPSAVSMLNRGASFSRFFPVYDMVNKGTGYNYGLELTVEKLFSNHYFFLFSGSLYNSKYKGSNGVENNTDYNGRFATNLLAGVEYDIGKKKKSNINIGFKLTYAGGRLYSDVDTMKSNRIMDIVPLDSATNIRQFEDYFRTDLRIAYKINGKRTSWEIALDLVNITNQKNVLALSYSPDPTNPQANPYVKNYQLGFLPLFYVKVDF
ncbi:MAG: carboxypeptidase regulatory-like domain-containing protein [Bacteroidota bacterium]|jgi:hypothetical protein